MPAKQQTGIVPRSLNKKAHRVQFQINRIKANIELSEVTAVRLLNEDVRRNITEEGKDEGLMALDKKVLA